MNKLLVYFKNRFKTVYCDECVHRTETTWFGHHSCKAFPVTHKLTSGSKLERPKTKLIGGYAQCRNVKFFSWCKKYKGIK